MRKPRLHETATACARAFRLAWQSSPRLSLVQTLLAAVQALLPLVGLFALKRAVDAASSISLGASARQATGFVDLLTYLGQDPESRSVVFWFVAGAAVMAVMAILRTMVAWVAEQHAIAVSDHVHGLLHGKMMELDLAFFENTAEQNRLHLVQEQAMTRPVGVLGGVFKLMQGAVGLVGVMVLLAALEPLLALVLVLAVQLFGLLVAAGILLWLTGQLIAGVITLGSLVMYAQAVQRSQGQVGTLVSALVEIHQSSLFLTAFDELLTERTLVGSPPDPRPVPARIQTGVVFEKVSFVYPGTDRPVLRDLSFTLRAGERLALAGANGAGKSTVVKLLARLYDPTSGRILVDGIDLREFDPAEWRRRIGVLFQDFGRYQLSAAENIWIGDPHGSAADPRIAAAASRVGLDDTVRQWPQGLATPLGRWLHEGVEPSMGQWQRLAIARAVVRDADLLVMDEPTSALDPHTQRDIFRLLQDAAAGRMTLLVSHRPELLALADRIIVLRDGAVAEEGTADTLRAGTGEFARIFAERSMS